MNANGREWNTEGRSRVSKAEHKAKPALRIGRVSYVL